MDSAYENLFFPVLLISLSLVLFARLARMILAGTAGASGIAGGVYRRDERPGEYWIEVALYVGALCFLCWCVFELTTVDRLLSANLLLLLIAMCATLIARLLVKGFVSADNRYFRRIERTDPYWLFVAIFGTTFLILVVELLDRWKLDYENLVSLAIYLGLSLFILSSLVRTLATGTVDIGAAGPVSRHGEWPVEYWTEVAILALALACVGWMALLAAVDNDRPAPASALLLQIALCAAFVVKGLAKGFVSADNGYVRRIERTGAFWFAILFFGAITAGLVYILLERRP